MKTFFNFKNLKRLGLVTSATLTYYAYTKFNIKNHISITKKDYEMNLKENRSENNLDFVFDSIEGGNRILPFLFEKYSDKTKSQMIEENEENAEDIELIRKSIDHLEEIINLGSISKIFPNTINLLDVYGLRNDDESKEKVKDYKSISIYYPKTFSYLRSKLEKFENTEGDLEYKEEKSNDDKELEELNLEEHFGKVLIYKYKDKIYATGAFCGNCMNSLMSGVLLGCKLTCCHCLSEYNITTGTPERGLNSKHLATFPVKTTNGNCLLSIPKIKNIPQFQDRIEVKQNSNYDPRHMILVGATPTTLGALNILLQAYPGKISILTNKDPNFFLSYEKLHSSIYPSVTNSLLDFPEKIVRDQRVTIIDEKIVKIDVEKREVTLDNESKLPFDKILISTGMKRASVSDEMINSFSVNTPNENKKLVQFVANQDTNSLVVLGNNFESLKIISAIRRFSDFIKKPDMLLGLVVPGTWFLDKRISKEASEIIEKYLNRNRIDVYKDMNVRVKLDTSGKKINNLTLGSKLLKNLIELPVDGVVIEDGVTETKVDFIDRILDSKSTQKPITYDKDKIIMANAKFSIQSLTKYPHIFASGNCAKIKNTDLPGFIHTEDEKTNYDLGVFAGLSMLDVHVPYSDAPIEVVKILDKKLSFIGNSNIDYQTQITFLDKKEEKFITYFIVDDQVKAILTFGYHRLDVFMKEALQRDLMPKPEFIIRNLEKAHQIISEKVVQHSSNIGCIMDEAINKTNEIVLSQFGRADQAYKNDLIARFEISKIKTDAKNQKEFNEDMKLIEKKYEEVDTIRLNEVIKTLEATKEYNDDMKNPGKKK